MTDNTCIEIFLECSNRLQSALFRVREASAAVKRVNPPASARSRSADLLTWIKALEVDLMAGRNQAIALMADIDQESGRPDPAPASDVFGDQDIPF